MAYGRPVHIRSHRRSGKRRRKVQRTMRVTLGVVLLAAGLVFGYTQLLANTCSGQETLRAARADGRIRSQRLRSIA